MNNYKIKVNDEAESKESQELFFELGAVCSQSKKAIFNQEPMSFIYFNGSTIYYGHDDENDEYWFLSDSSGKELTLPELRDLVAQSKSKEQSLISWADALRALADGKEVEYLYGDKWLSVVGEQVLITAVTDDKFKFRLKPSTIKLELDIPAPFEPKEKDIFWTLSTNYKCGYVQILCYRNDEQGEILAQFGAWRTEEQVKQVVAALRGGIKG